MVVEWSEGVAVKLARGAVAAGAAEVEGTDSTGGDGAAGEGENCGEEDGAWSNKLGVLDFLASEGVMREERLRGPLRLLLLDCSALLFSFFLPMSFQ